MAAGESAQSPQHTITGEESTDDGLRKRSASPRSSNHSSWDNPAKKFCTDPINVTDWVENTTDAPPIVQDISEMYKENRNMLNQMGFKTGEIELSLRLSNNDVEKAIQYLTREIDGLDSSKQTSSNEQANRNMFYMPEMMRSPYIESDEEELKDENRLKFPEEDVLRVRHVLEQYNRHIFYRKNGALSRCLTVAKNILYERTEGARECVAFVDEILYFVITRHVNPPDSVFLGEQELALIEELYREVIPLLCKRLTYSPINVKVCLIIDEMFTTRNRFITKSSAKLTNRRFEEPVWCNRALIDKLENTELYAELVDEFVSTIIPCINEKIETADNETTPIEIIDFLFLLRAMNTVTSVIDKTNQLFLENIELWVGKALRRLQTVSDKEIRDVNIRRQGLELIQEIVIMCEKFDFDVFVYTQEARMEFLRRWIKCPQMECMLHSLEELGQLADGMTRSVGLRSTMNVSEEYFKTWLDDNHVLQIVLTGNMDHAVYVEKIQPILQYMTPELAFDDIKFIWSLRKGRMGVSVDNFNKIMDMILRSLNSQQTEWVIELFKKSFRNRETRLFESIFNFCYTLGVHKDRDDEEKLRITKTIWELILMCRGPPTTCSFKSIEMGMRKHCDLLNSMMNKTERDRFVLNMVDGMRNLKGFTEVHIVYLYIMLDKLKRLYFPRRLGDRSEEATTKATKLREMLRDRNLFLNLLERLSDVRKMAHEYFEAATLTNMISTSQDSMSNLAFELTNDDFIGSDSIMKTILFGCTDYCFVIQNTLKLMKWLHDNDCGLISNDFIENLFNVFVFAPDATKQEQAEIFHWLNDLKLNSVSQETSRKILVMLARLDVFTFEINGLKCFAKYLEDMPNMCNEEEARPMEAHMMKKMTDLKLFMWKLILFNHSDEVVDKCIETFCEREVISVDSPRFLRLNTLHFLSVFSYYVEQLKAELYNRKGIPNTVKMYDTTDLEISEDEIRQHEIPLNEMLIETVGKAIDRLIRFLSRFVELGNEKNNMVRQYPSHGSSISGHTVTFSIELKNDEEDIDEYLQWKSLVCDSNTTIGEFKVRLTRRMLFHESMYEVTVQRREDDITLQETPLKYDYMTLQSVRLASESESIFLSEKIRILVKPKRQSSRRNEYKKAIREDFLPAAIVSKCNFYDLLHDLSSIGDTSIRASCRKLLLMLPTQPSIVKALTFDEMIDKVSLSDKLVELCTKMMDPTEPLKMLYCLEAMSSILASTRLTPASCDDSNELAMALIECDVLKNLINNVLKTPNVITLHKCTQNDRHAILERIVQILRCVYVGRSTMWRASRNEKLVRNEMIKTAEHLIHSRQDRPLEPNVDHVIIHQQTLPDTKHVMIRNNPLLSCDQEVAEFDVMSTSSIKKTSLDTLIELLTTLRNFVWVHVATESFIQKPVLPYFEDEAGNSSSNGSRQLSASERIRSSQKVERWGDECWLVIVRKVLSTMRHLIRLWVKGREENSAVRLLATMFIKSTWMNFYQDVLVNSHQEAYRKYMQEMLVKLSKDNGSITCMTLKMLLDLFAELPLKEKLTKDLGELDRRQRMNCDILAQTIAEIVYYEIPPSKYYLTDNKKRRIDWSSVGHQPISIVNEQMRSLMDFPPRFSHLDCDLSHTENSYASAKMKMITCMLQFCDQEQIENISIEFIQFVLENFLFPDQPDIEQFMFEEESLRWEGSCRDMAIMTINILCERSYKNMNLVFQLMDAFPTLKRVHDPAYKPVIRPRAFDQVGLKNDGGTCYMNATIQQLVHVPGLAQKMIAMKNVNPSLNWGDNNSALLCELQNVFAQLIFNRAQAVVPDGLWREFRFEPDVPLNTKQHHDAIDFYSILLDKCDNVLKKLELPPIFQNFFGKYSYEKICYGCWHRYKSPDEEFNCISLALNGDNLEEAIESFLEGHVMEGENAYHCEKCDEKKTTLNRTSFLELPNTMTIQLKRFTYDMINNVIRKDNQYFKFPFTIDMQPYTTSSRHVPDEQVQDLFDDMLYSGNDDASSPQPNHQSNGSPEKPQMAGFSLSAPTLDSPVKKTFRRHRSSTLRLSQSFATVDTNAPPPPPKPLIYELVGVLAHSGVATAGHYYSFVKERRDEFKDSSSYGKWYHLNDMVSTPMAMNSIEDTWFGGTFQYENNYNDERIRHWNAYVLFYEKRNDEEVENEKAMPVVFDVTGNILKETSLVERNKKSVEVRKEFGMNEARKLRIKMFHSMDDRLKSFLNEENVRFLKDRDYFSFDIYNLFVTSCLQLLRRSDRVKYTVDGFTRQEFLFSAFLNCFTYIVNIAWPMFDDARPKHYPKNTVDLIKYLLNGNFRNKFLFFTTIEANEFEVMNRLIDASEQDVRHSFWQLLKYALRQWCQEVGVANSNGLPTRGSGDNRESTDSTDLDDDDDDEDDEEEDEDLEDEDTESEGDAVANMVRIAPISQQQEQHTKRTMMAVVAAAAAAASNTIVPIDLRRSSLTSSPSIPGGPLTSPVQGAAAENAIDPVAAAAALEQQNVINMTAMIMMEDPHAVQRAIIRRICHIFTSRHLSRNALDCLLSIARTNHFASAMMLSCGVLSCVTDVLFEGHNTVFSHLRYPDNHLKATGLWPNLPALYFELLYNHLEILEEPHIDGHMTINHVIEIIIIYCCARDDADTSGEKMVNDPKAMHNRITGCFAQQIVLLSSEDDKPSIDYIFNLTQGILKEMCVVTGQFTDEHWPFIVAFITSLSEKLYAVGSVSLSLRLLEDFLHVPIEENEQNIHPGLLPEMVKLNQFNDLQRAKKMFVATYYLRTNKNQDIRSLLETYRVKFPSVYFSYLDVQSKGDISLSLASSRRNPALRSKHFEFNRATAGISVGDEEIEEDEVIGEDDEEDEVEGFMEDDESNRQIANLPLRRGFASSSSTSENPLKRVANTTNLRAAQKMVVPKSWNVSEAKKLRDSSIKQAAQIGIKRIDEASATARVIGTKPILNLPTQWNERSESNDEKP